ncbi:MAG: inositol monophosphatase [Ruminococcaceae bacterium]|nr:inositol monophosphatase [Oscillospiraceae bacterium]
MKELTFLKGVLPRAYSRFCDGEVIVSDKAAFDVVTNVDKEIELYFAEELKKAFPEDALLGEEFSADQELAPRTWILDPIDGTYNFSIGSRLFGLQAAFMENGETVASVIYLPNFGELYEATKDGGAFCNGNRLFVSDRKIRDSIVSFGDLPHARPHDAAEQGRMMQKAYSAIARLRMYGAACLDFANLASGKTEGVVLFTRNKWDLAPGLLLSREAGAVLLGVDGEPYTFSSRGIFACNRRELYEALK